MAWCMPSKIWYGYQIISFISLWIEILMWLGFLVTNFVSPVPDQLTFTVIHLSSMTMMLMELYGTAKKNRKTMVTAIAFRWSRVMSISLISICLYYNFFNLDNILSLDVAKTFLSWFLIIPTLWDTFKLYLDCYVFSCFKYNHYESLP